MKLRYFPATDTLSITLTDLLNSSSEVISDNLIVDYDANGKPAAPSLQAA